MIKITHYEVYTDRGDGWKLEERFSSDQRYDAINLAKEKDAEKIKGKIIKETFDVQDNSYQETVEYVSGLSSNKNVSDENMRMNPAQAAAAAEAAETERLVAVSSPNVIKAVLKLLSIIVLCLVFANILVTLLAPVIEIFASEETTKPILFAVFFVLFLSIAIPLLIKNVPWYVFSSRSTPPKIREKKFFNKAEAIIKRYNINDNFDADVVPAYPEAPLEYKRYIVDFLKNIVSSIDSKSAYSDSFSKFGIKLIIYGGCLELSRYSGLKIMEANSLLHEAFAIIDGGTVDLSSFYEAKRSYKDNKVAIFLSGVGAYLMERVLEERPIDKHILRESFAKWEALNQNRPVEDNEPRLEADIMFKSQVNLKSDLTFLADNLPDEEQRAEKISAELRNIVNNLLGKYAGRNVIEAEGVTSVEFDKLNQALRFSREYLKDVTLYRDELNEEELTLKNMCSIMAYQSADAPNLNDLVKDIFEHVYDGEVVVTGEVKNTLEQDGRYNFDFLGEKKLSHSGEMIPLYKLLS